MSDGSAAAGHLASLRRYRAASVLRRAVADDRYAAACSHPIAAAASAHASTPPVHNAIAMWTLLVLEPALASTR